jgi:mRNA-degrading endonuclease RelE of RelBE toxin-antitoxin system
MARQRLEVLFAPETLDHLKAIERRYHSFIRAKIDEQLTHSPERETRNRKRLEQPAPYAATWELRFGPGNRFRVFYEVNASQHTVSVLAIGLKDRNRLLIGAEEFEL